MRRTGPFLLAAIAFGLPEPGVSQDARILEPGLRVRLWHDCQVQRASSGRVRETCEKKVGTFLATRGDSVSVAVLGSGAEPSRLVLPAYRVSRIDVSAGEVPLGTVEGPPPRVRRRCCDRHRCRRGRCGTLPGGRAHAWRRGRSVRFHITDHDSARGYRWVPHWSRHRRQR